MTRRIRAPGASAADSSFPAMRLTPVTLLAGPAGSGAQLLRRAMADADWPAALVVVDEGAASASPECTCCALADGLTRTLREAHFARVEGRARDFTRVVVDATGTDPRPAIAALARTPLASLRLALSSVVAVTMDGVGDPLAALLADIPLDAQPGRAAALFSAELYRDGTPDARGWLDRGPPGRLGWDRPEPCAWEDVEAAVQALQLHAGPRLARLKGLVHVAGEPGPRLVQAFGHTRYPSARLPAWPDAGRYTRLRIAGEHLATGEIARIFDSIPRRPSSP